MADATVTREGRLALVERFYTVQGEGHNAGRAALFIRFAGCNLDCHFADGSICDTPWRHANVKVEMDELLEWVRSGPNETPWPIPPLVVLTGGEPTMAPRFSDLVRRLKGMGYPVAVETNGTTWADGLELCDWIACSPKDQVAHDSPLGSPDLHPDVVDLVTEWRYVVTGPAWEEPPVRRGMHYVSPALKADGSGQEHRGDRPPAFVPGAVERALEVVKNDPRWRLSLQTHKWLGVR